MRMRFGWKTPLLAAVLLLVAIGCAPSLQRAKPTNAVDHLRTELDYLFSDRAFANAHWGVAIQSLRNGEYLYLRNEGKEFMPASNMKLFTTAAALVKLSPEFRHRTALLTTGSVREGVLEGPLLIKGSGDPSITGRYHGGNMLAVFQAWADSLRRQRIRRVSGDIIGDDNYFADEILGRGWSWDYQSDFYAAQISALSFNDNCMDIIFTPGDSVGKPVQFRLEPATDYVQVNCLVTTAAKGRAEGVTFDRAPGTNRVTVRGSIAIDAGEIREWFSVENPTLFAAHVFRQTLIDQGIAVEGRAIDIDSLPGFTPDPACFRVLATYTSPPLSELVTTINKVSQNLYAELLLRTLGAECKGTGDAAHGAEVVKEVVTGFGVDPEVINMVDGSGLSRLDMVTPMAVVALLRGMRRHATGTFFYDSLPIAGVDGTIRSRMRGTAAENNVRAKTGFIGHVRSLSGYVRTADQEELAFAIIANNYTAPTPLANSLQDLVCERLATFSRMGP
ncbi:MAG: D-alanyl-D-alanine carboxypeptidase/D-alanyl-D-alanine-endopeptidase [bacterium]|jgi:D-alanyl-D-alanine carboxypeptidase/D-alanyl-D-alanine-endopeptidase (penicillin-binding protein 4)|nr:D-alanyl-D-alanine carboxypeptidase/D-alanyl-D-alanine-endopeptidase [candidate division KSB1 bacterium]MDH7561036.1 D-alanyl-D-alanine carboxypeptidase/D-alanyl-D-alanine-endopeptidase [bacterium]